MTAKHVVLGILIGEALAVVVGGPVALMLWLGFHAGWVIALVGCVAWLGGLVIGADDFATMLKAGDDKRAADLAKLLEEHKP